MGKIFKQLKGLTMEERIMLFSKWTRIKDLLFFAFKFVVGIIFKSWVLVAIALYDLCVGVTKATCSHGLKKGDDTVYDLKIYVRGGMILSISSVFYLAFSVTNFIFPSNIKYNLIVGLLIATISTYNIIVAVVGLCHAKGKNMLAKEYKLTSFSKAITNLFITQMAILSFTCEQDMSKYNTIFGVVISVVILCIGLYLIIDGKSRKKMI